MWRATEVQEAMRRGHQGGGRWLPLGTDMAQELFQGAVREHCRLSCVAGACKLLATCTQRSCWLTCVGLQLVKLAQDGGGGGGGAIHAESRHTCCREDHSKAEQAARLHQQGQARRHLLLAHQL